MAAWERSTLARADARLAFAWLSRATKADCSSFAITWSFFTVELKSAQKLG